MQEQLRSIILPPDPLPIFNPRPEQYPIEEGGLALVDQFGNILVDQNGATLEDQPTAVVSP